MMLRVSRLLRTASLACFVALLFWNTAHGDGTKSKETPRETKADKATTYYNDGIKQAEFEEYEQALKLFEKANRERKNDPEILNMLAFTQRKLGKLDEAFENYEKALKLRPDFAQAREYLGEAHIQAALAQVALLRSYGGAGEEQLAKLVAAFKEAAELLGDGALEKRSGSAGGWKNK